MEHLLTYQGPVIEVDHTRRVPKHLKRTSGGGDDLVVAPRGGQVVVGPGPVWDSPVPPKCTDPRREECGYDKGSLLRDYSQTRPLDGYHMGEWEGHSYIGEWKDGVPDGEGRLQGGDYYSGEWHHGYRHGQGTAYWNPGEPRFIGEWSNGLPYNGVEYKMEGQPLGRIVNGEYKD